MPLGTQPCLRLIGMTWLAATTPWPIPVDERCLRQESKTLRIVQIESIKW
jgi:hypothetical protein